MPAALAGSALALLATLPARAAYPAAAEGTGLAVVTDHAEATHAALDVLHAGGNAVDGAIAATLMLGVVGPNASGLGGGGFALVYVAKEKKTYALDFRETAPGEVNMPAILERTNRDPAKRGVAVGIPGEPAGIEWLSKKLAKKSLADDAAAAVALAKRGFPVTRQVIKATEAARAELTSQPELNAVFFGPASSLLPFARNVPRPDLASTIAKLGAQGAKPFYEGDIAAKIAKAAAALGGTMKPEDLAGYKVVEREPLTRTYDGRTIATFPAPSAGGLMLLEVLGELGASYSASLGSIGFGSSGYFHTVAEAMRGALADRMRMAGDPDLDPNVAKAYEAALDPKQLAARRAKFEPNKTHPAMSFPLHEEGTSHVIVADRDGNVVSLTSSINQPFGARIAAGDTGIVLNDELDDFTAPADLHPFGVIGLGPNRPKAHARPVSSMAPTIVFESGVPILALGGEGGDHIATGVTQAAVARLVYGLDPGTCVSAPRVHIQGAMGLIMLPSDVPQDVKTALRLRGELPRDDPYPNAAVSMVAWERGPFGGARVLAAADPRKEGYAAAE